MLRDAGTSASELSRIATMTASGAAARLFKLTQAGLLGLAMASSALAQTFPARPVTFITPQPAGSGDANVRLFAPGIGELLGQPIIIENRPGASTNLGTALGAKAAPDGYTMTVNFVTMVINPLLYKSAGFKQSDFVPVTLMFHQDNCIAINPNLPVKSLSELVTYVKANPGKLTFADQGGNQLLHMSILFNQLGMKFLMVPYNGPPMNDLVAGTVDVTANGPTLVIPLHKAGKVRMLAWTGTQRKADLPDMPTAAEILPGWTYLTWSGLVAPVGTPRDRIDRIQRATATVIKRPDIQAKLGAIFTEGVGSTPEEFAAILKEAEGRLSKVITELGLHQKFES